MREEDFARAFKLLFENFWILREEMPDDYQFLRRNQKALTSELRQRFGMNLLVRPQFIQLLKRPHELAPWMGEVGFSDKLDYVLFACGMAYVEDLEAETPFMMDEMIRELEIMAPEEVELDWTNYMHRRSMVRAITKMLGLKIIDAIQGETTLFEQGEENQEVLFITTPQARYFLSRAPQSYTEYEDFTAFWQDTNENRNLEKNQMLYQRLFMEPFIKRDEFNEELFVRLRNYYRYMQEYIEKNSYFDFELYRDYAALTLEQRDGWKEIFPSRQVIDEILIQLVTLIRQEEIVKANHFGEVIFSMEEWNELLAKLRESYVAYWSKEFVELTPNGLSQRLLARGASWQLLKIQENTITIQPVVARTIAEMRQEDAK